MFQTLPLPGRPDPAEADAEAAPPDTWERCVRRGNFAAAWRHSDATLRARAGETCWHLPRHEQWLWDGRSLVGQRVLVHCYHGLGDTVQFIRYAPLLRALAREVTVWTQPALVSLVRGVAGVDRTLALHDGAPGIERDADVEIMELPHVFRSTLGTLPANVPYLRAKPAARVGDGRKYRVGVVWQAGGWDGRRSVPLETLAPLAEIPGIELHALQRGDALCEWPSTLGPVSGSDNAEVAAGVLRALDLVLTVDSFPAHLAGALGCPVWTLLHATPDWRWMDARDDSPWYPTMRLFRQERAGDWTSVIARVTEELRRVSGARPR